MEVTAGQMVLLGAAAVAFVAAAAVGFRHLRRRPTEDTTEEPASGALGPQARTAVAVGAGLSAALFLWRATASGTIRNPLTTYFDAFLILGLILTAMLVYFRLTRHLRSFCIFLLPMIAAVLLIGGGLQVLSVGVFDKQTALTVGHITTVMLGFACCAVSSVAGVIYLFADRQLRQRGVEKTRWAGLPPLASIEKFNHRVVLLGFPLLTIAMITGGILTEALPGSMEAFAGWSKVLLAALAWGIFGFLLLIRLMPAFRGRRAAQLSIAGFVVLIAAFVMMTRVPR